MWRDGTGRARRREPARRAVVDDPAADEHDPVDDVLDGAELVRDVEDRDAELCAAAPRGARPSDSCDAASTPVVGSSRASSVGSEASALAISARCCIPPESVRSGASARSASPTRSIARVDRLAVGPAQRPPDAGGRQASGRDDLPHGHRGLAERAGCAAGGSRSARRRRPRRRLPKTRTAPVVGRSSPSTSRSRVVLPPPFGPAIATNSPGSPRARRPRARGRPPR